MTPESLAAHLADSPPGYAEWWVNRYGTEEFTTAEQKEAFVMGAIAWEGALEFAERLVGELIPSELDPPPHVVTG